MKMSIRKVLWLMFLAAVCSLTPSLLLAQDSDGDGLTDAFETSYPPTAFTCMAGDSCASVPGCTWQNYKYHNYLYCTTSLTWQDARDFCRGYGGDLVAVSGDAEETVIESYLVDNSHYWIGASDLNLEDVFEWSHGTPFVYTDWGIPSLKCHLSNAS